MADTGADTLVSSLWEQSGASGFAALLPEALGAAAGGSTQDILQTLDGETVLGRLWEAAATGRGGAVSLCGQLCGVLVLCAVWKKYRETAGGATGDLFSGCVTVLTAILAFRALENAFSDAAAFFVQIHTAVSAALTALTALSVMRGMVQTAAVTGMGMAFFLAVTEVICTGVLWPFVRLCTGLSLAAAVGGTGAPGQLSGLLRRQFLWITGAVMTVLCAVLSYQSVLARAADSVTMRAVKFTLSGAVPIIGGAVGEAASTVAAGFSLARKSVGVLGVALVLWQIMPPLCGVLLLRLAFSLSSSVASFLAMEREEALLRECASLAGFLLAVLCAEALLYILMLTLCMGGS